ncbi:hypothetical protein GLAREA_04114 [Glarea lozoyensis ATCC 20868]|uniref:DUF7143 domain-containing protein n=1 Tax=Glarea lozoyensis (strain ATCC 20868 / MF5171) TaxID=1116229 RepID=S3CXT2_GLAL2|nr:uncharacterized protein GLAREA_04114 [Glarea lozoyensis ATCC 20868]EPE31147.1 hypothetical protein GLAREA_04114 [Glarea lozoyensis ATCC 20868]
MLSQYVVVALVAGLAVAGPISLVDRQAKACFIVGNTALPAEVQDTVTSIQGSVTCNPGIKTLSGVPDVSSGGVSYSSIDFSASSKTPLEFALDEFATASPLAASDLALFEDRLATYLATEAGIRSVGGNLAIKAPKFFQSFQIARIKAAQGVVETDPGQTVDHLLGKVTKNAGSAESKATLDAITALATQLK